MSSTNPSRSKDSASLAALLEDAIEAIDEGFMLFDADDRLVARNSRYLELYGVTEDEYAIGMLWTDLLRNNVAKNRYVQAIGREEAFIAERLAHRGRPGAVYEIHLDNGRWLRATDRRTREGGMVSIRMDVTEQKRAEQQLRELERTARESEARIRQILDLNPLPVTITRLADGLILYANERVAEMLKVRAEELVGTPMTRFFVDESERRTILAELEEKDCTSLLEIEFQRSDGSTFPLAGISRKLDYLGEPCIVSGLHDLSEWRRMESRFHQNEKLAAMGSLLAGVAHELNNPLAVVLAQSTLMKDKAPDPATLARAEKISSAATRCARIVRSFLAIARQRPPVYAAISLAQVLDQALELTSYGLRTAGIVVERHIPENLTAWGDADQIGQVLMNLIVNAQQALADRPTERQLRISAELNGAAEVTISVADNGPGVPAAIASRIFEPFFTTKAVGVGTGVGLSVCLGIVQAHGGTMCCEGTPGGGATFRVTLPARQDVRSDPKPAAPAEAGQRSASSILIVDDEPDIAELLGEIVSPLARRIDIAGSGQEALRLLGVSAYDLVITDVRMPDLDGPTLLRRARALLEPYRGPMLFVTGDTLQGPAADTSAQPGLSSIEKPFEPEELQKAALGLLNGRRGH